MTLDAQYINSHQATEAHLVCSLSKVDTSIKEKSREEALPVSEERKSCRKNGQDLNQLTPF